MKLKIVSVLILISTISFAQVPSNYYDSAIGLTGYTLKTELSNIISNGHVNQGYNALYTGYQTTDRDYYYENDGTVLDMYSENPTGTDPYNYTPGTNQCGNYSSEGDCYNREHLMPQSWFNSASPMVADIHQVVPADGKVNGQRGHLPFGEVNNPNWTSLNGSKRGPNTLAGYSGTVFEPIDEFKGDIARIYFYMATRYQDNIASWENANSGSDATLNGSSDQVFEDWMLDMLLSWNANDPVSQREIDRNNAAYNFQGNANPFINHPEWVNVIWNPTPDTENPTDPTNLIASNTTNFSTDLSWTASTDNVHVLGYDIYRDNTLLTTVYNTTYIDTSLLPNTSYNYYVVAKDDTLNYSDNSNTVVVNTLNGPTFLISEDFNNCNTVSTNFIAHNEASNKNWMCNIAYGENDTGSYQMNGYQEDVASKDWLVSAYPIPFTQYNNEKLEVFLKHQYGTTELELVYSTDYLGNGNPENYTWTSIPNVTIETPDGTPVEYTQTITDADISGIAQDAYIAFKYYSDGFPTRWIIDNFKIKSTSTASVNNYVVSNEISIYPNPSSTNSFTVKSVANISSVKISTMLGQIIQLDKNINLTEINYTNLPKGVYFVAVISGTKMDVKSVIIQ